MTDWKERWLSLTPEERIAEWHTLTREQRLDEPGTEPPCPFCQRPRVKRSSYIRCNPCGMNWGMDDEWSRNPKGQDREREKGRLKANAAPADQPD